MGLYHRVQRRHQLVCNVEELTISLRIVNIKVLKKLAVFPVLEEITGCEIPSPADCGSGSGSGGCEGIPCDEECVETCQQCDSMSGVWELTIDGVADHIPLCHLANPNDGNYCRFVSQDLTWELYYSASSGLWIVVNYSTDAFYYMEGLDWICDSANTLTDLDGGPNAIVDPVSTCPPATVPCGFCVRYTTPNTEVVVIPLDPLSPTTVAWYGGESVIQPGSPGVVLQTLCTDGVPSLQWNLNDQILWFGQNWAVAVWDGTGCATFTRYGPPGIGPTTIEVCCSDPP